MRTDYPEDVVRGALTLSELRLRGQAKFTRAKSMWFDRVGLEQSTAEAVARHKSKRFSGRVWDYCSGIGGDAIMLARSCDVIAVDRDPAACLCTLWNAEVYEVEKSIAAVCTDIESLGDRSGYLHIDPDRRTGSRRSLKMEEGSPGLSFLKQSIGEFRGGALKASPAANFGGKFPGAEIELVSVDGECKEATIWFGELAAPETWRATVLPAGETIAGDPLAWVAALAPLGRFLFDPDPAIVRAGLVDMLATRDGFGRLDQDEEYLTADRVIATPFARSFEVLAELPNNERAIRDYFRNSSVGQLEIKCRHIPIDAESIRRRITLAGDEAAVLIFARIAGRSRAVVGRRITANGA